MSETSIVTVVLFVVGYILTTIYQFVKLIHRFKTAEATIVAQGEEIAALSNRLDNEIEALSLKFDKLIEKLDSIRNEFHQSNLQVVAIATQLKDHLYHHADFKSELQLLRERLEAL